MQNGSRFYAQNTHYANGENLSDSQYTNEHERLQTQLLRIRDERRRLQAKSPLHRSKSPNSRVDIRTPERSFTTLTQEIDKSECCVCSRLDSENLERERLKQDNLVLTQKMNDLKQRFSNLLEQVENDMQQRSLFEASLRNQLEKAQKAENQDAQEQTEEASKFAADIDEDTSSIAHKASITVRAVAKSDVISPKESESKSAPVATIEDQQKAETASQAKESRRPFEISQGIKFHQSKDEIGDSDVYNANNPFQRKIDFVKNEPPKFATAVTTTASPDTNPTPLSISSVSQPSAISPIPGQLKEMPVDAAVVRSPSPTFGQGQNQFVMHDPTKLSRVVSLPPSFVPQLSFQQSPPALAPTISANPFPAQSYAIKSGPSLVSGSPVRVPSSVSNTAPNANASTQGTTFSYVGQPLMTVYSQPEVRSTPYIQTPTVAYQPVQAIQNSPNVHRSIVFQDHPKSRSTEIGSGRTYVLNSAPPAPPITTSAFCPQCGYSGGPIKTLPSPSSPADIERLRLVQKLLSQSPFNNMPLEELPREYLKLLNENSLLKLNQK